MTETATMCTDCADDLGRALGDIAWLDEQLDITATKTSGVDYRTIGGSKGGKKPAERPLPVHWGASEARTHLHALLVSWVRLCAEDGVASSDHRGTLPDDNLIAMSRWLLWRVDGLARHNAGPDALEEIASAVAHCERVIDRHADRQYLGTCSTCDLGSLYAAPGSGKATCDNDECRTEHQADDIRTNMIAALHDSLMTAADIARTSTYLGLQINRERVLSRITTWANRKRIGARGHIEGAPTYRFGDVYALLQDDTPDGKSAGSGGL